MQKNIFSPDNAKSLSNLELKAKLVVEGFITGIHKSPYHGFWWHKFFNKFIEND